MQKFKPRFYVGNAQLLKPTVGNILAGANGQASITIQNVPFILRKITASNLGPSNIDWIGLGLPPSVFDDTAALFWSFQMRTDSHVYLNDQALIVPTLGSAEDFFDLPSPVELQPKATVTFDVTTLVERTQTSVLQFILHGVEPAESFGERV